MPPPMEDFDLIVKVKFGNTLRRFSVYVHGSYMDIDITGLRAKVANFFKLSEDLDFTMAYTDEDNDVVTLVENDDLIDAVLHQHLNPLRINVILNNSTTETFDTRSQSGSSTSIRSPQVQSQLPRISSGVEEALKSVPEPLHSTLLKLSHDLMSKATSMPALGELLDYFSKLGQSLPSTLSKGDASSSKEPRSVSVDLNVTAGQGDTGTNAKVLRNENSTGNKVKGHEGNVARDTGVAPAADLNLEFARHQHVSSGLSNLVPTTFASKTTAELDNVVPTTFSSKSTVELPKKTEGHDGLLDAFVAFSSPSGNLMDLKPSPSQATESHVSICPQSPGNSSILDGDKNKQPFTNPGHSVITSAFSPQRNAGTVTHIGPPLADVVPTGGFYRGGHPFKRSYSQYDSTFRTFHKGVQCDGCGMHPIIGPRFKSEVKEDYDLCNICFSEMGNEADYTRIDHSIHPLAFKEIHSHPQFWSPFLHGNRVPGQKPSRAKLESLFIKDVTVLDGTLMAPATPFTKIWRMRNSGSVSWPLGTQLVWNGGDQFGDRGSVELEIPGNGCPPAEEIDIAVDFTAPSRPGRYISYWRMMSPLGQKFGQRVWVLIQVDNSQQESSPRNVHTGLNLNLPPEQKGQEMIDVNADPVEADRVRIDDSNMGPELAELVKPLVDGVALPVETSAPLLYPIVNVSAPPPPPTLPPEVRAAATGGTKENTVEETLLKELEEMGFKQIYLNKEILRMNEYDLENSLADLCSVAEWDPFLEELQEMGFSDRKLNKRLLVKNGGSIKRVVLDLIAREE